MKNLLVLLSVVLVVALAACAAPATPVPPTPTSPPGVTPAAPTPTPPPAERTLTVWGFVWTADWLDAMAPGFEAEHPGVKVDVQRFEYDPYQDMVISTLASGVGVPDVVTLDPMWTGDLIRGGTVIPLDKAEEELNVDDFVPGGWYLYSWQGVQYGVPLDLDWNLLFYRQDVYGAAMEALGMTEFPRTTEEFLRLAQEITKETGKPAILLYQGDYYAWYQSFLAPLGGNLMNEDGTEYIFNSDVAVEALQLYSDLVKVHEVGRLWDSEIDGDSMVAVSGGDVMAIMHGSWYATEIASGAPDMAGQWAIAALPWGEEGRPYDAATGGACLSIPKGADDPDLAWEFLKYAETPESMAEYYRIVAGVPALKTSWGDPAFDEVNEYFGVAMGDTLSQMALRAMPMQLPSLEVADLIGEAISKVTTGQATAKEALDEAVAAAPPLQ